MTEMATPNAPLEPGAPCSSTDTFVIDLGYVGLDEGLVLLVRVERSGVATATGPRYERARVRLVEMPTPIEGDLDGTDERVRTEHLFDVVAVWPSEEDDATTASVST